MPSEYQQIKNQSKKLCSQEPHSFPKPYGRLDVPKEHGVYIIREEIRRRKKVLHVGRTLRGKGGLHQRLMNHLHGSSSFTIYFLGNNGAKLREDRYTYQYLIVEEPRERALLEAYTTGTLCPEHVGLGEEEEGEG